MVRSLCRSNEWLCIDEEKQYLDIGEECTVLMCWALGCQYPLPPRGRAYTARELEWLSKKGQTFYQVALLAINDTHTGLDTLSMLHVKLLMCLYLLTMARLKAAWDLFAAVKHMANSLDLSRPAITINGKDKTLQATLRSRVFWAVYTLDTYLCTMLGKMLTFGERDIKVKHTTTDDLEIEPAIELNQVWNGNRPELSLMLGPAIHAKLARIVRQALRDLYLDYNGQYNAKSVRSLATEIKQWEEELPEIFRLSSVGGLEQIVARQAAVIRLALQHALILIYRPSLPLSSLAHHYTIENDHTLQLQEIREHQDLCLQAATVASNTVANLVKKGSLSGTYWFSAYINFCAGTVMLVYLGHNIHRLEPHRRRELWQAAQDCCETERQLATTNRLARRYVAALEASNLDCAKDLTLTIPQALSEQLNKRLIAAEQWQDQVMPVDIMTSPANISFSNVGDNHHHYSAQSVSCCDASYP
jgi:hypothetical protein